MVNSTLTFLLQVEEDRKTREHVDIVFRKLDINQDGVITLEEFIESCLKVKLFLVDYFCMSDFLRKF